MAVEQKGTEEISDEDRYEWVGQRFHLNPGALTPLLASLMVEVAVEEGTLNDWEVEALDQGQLPELPRDRALRLSLEENSKQSPR